MKKSRIGFLLYWLLVTVYIIIIAADYNSLRFYVKPLLIPFLITSFVLSKAVKKSFAGILTAGLFFSFLGDVFLLWDDYFIPGLVCFLITHILYVIYFVNTANRNGWFLKKQPLIIILPLAYVIALVGFLLPHLGVLKIPVMAYAFFICLMALASINLYKQINKPAYSNFIAGAVFFVLSDSLLAIDKFYQHLPPAGIFIIFTYCLAQYLIVKGAWGMDDV